MPKLSETEGRRLRPAAAEALLEELRAQAKAAGDAKWEPDRDHKIIGREALRQWWDERTRAVSEAAAVDQPPLVIPQFPVSETTRLHFAARRVPFVGRDAELHRLRSFMDDGRPFGWWIITGSAGLGKSRLALECCLLYPAWRAGFLPRDHGMEKWRDWQPSRPTLILVDYASTRPAEVQGIIESLAARTVPPKHPVRLLLLERGSFGQWWDMLLGVGRTRHLLDHARFAEPMALSHISPDAVWNTIAFILKQSGLPEPADRSAILATLVALDPERRPLFAALAADALVANRDIRQWNRAELLDDVLRREATSFWQPAGATEPDRNLLALATMTGGLALSSLSDLPRDGFFPAAQNYEPERYAIMSGQPATERLAPLEPDIIGEFFTLEHVRPRHALDRDRAAKLRQSAWRHGPDGAIGFLTRAALDFRDHPSLALLTEPATEDALQRAAWSFLAANLIGSHGQAGDTARARAVYDQLAAVRDEFSTERPLVVAQSAAAFKLAATYGEAGDAHRAVEIVNELNDLSLMYLSVAEVRAAWAQGAANLIDDLATAGYLDEAEELYYRFATIASAMTEEPMLREAWAKGAVNLSGAYGNVGQADEVERLYYAVAALARDHPEETAIRGSFVKATHNAVLFLGKAKKLAEARAALRDLAVAAAAPQAASLRSRFAEIGLNFVKLAALADDVVEANEARDELRLLAERHPGEVDLYPAFAQCAAPLVAAYGRQRAFEEAEAICAEAAALARRPMPQPGLLLARARAAVALVVAQAAAGQFLGAQDTYRNLTNMTDAHSDPELREQRACAAFNLVSFLAQAGQWQLAHQFHDDCAHLAETFPSEPALREYLTKACFNLFESYRQADELDLARELCARLAEISCRCICSKGIRTAPARSPPQPPAS